MGYGRLQRDDAEDEAIVVFHFADEFVAASHVVQEIQLVRHVDTAGHQDVTFWVSPKAAYRARVTGQSLHEPKVVVDNRL